MAWPWKRLAAANRQIEEGGAAGVKTDGVRPEAQLRRLKADGMRSGLHIGNDARMSVRDDGRSKLGGDLAIPSANLHRHEARNFFQSDSGFKIALPAARMLREVDGAADRRMAREGNFGRRKENPHLGGVGRVIRRLNEDRLGKVELARDRLHPRGRQAVRRLDYG